MPYKDLQAKKDFQKRYRAEKGKEIDLKRKKVLEERYVGFSEEEKEKFIIKRRETCLKSYYKNRDKIIEKNKVNSHIRQLKYMYGLTYEKYEDILKSQKNKCAICGCNEFEKRWTSTKLPFAVDHCHDVGKIRGLLCDNCNVMLGHAQNNVTILKNAIKYLNKFNKWIKQEDTTKEKIGTN